MSDVACYRLEEIAVRELPASVEDWKDCLRTASLILSRLAELGVTY